MTTYILKEKISHTLEALIEQSSTILERNDQIPQIEIDITLSHIRDLYKTFLDLNKLNCQEEVAKLQSDKEPKKQSDLPIQESIIIDNLKDEISTPKKEIIEPTVSMPSPDLFSETVTPQPKKIQSEPKKLIFEQVGDTRISDKIVKPITSIKQAIGINERYQFMNLLFKGNHDEYAAIINTLDTCTTIEDAHKIIDKITAKFQWKEEIEIETLNKLNDLIARRFASQ